MIPEHEEPALTTVILGGDEFAVLLPDTDEAGALQVLTRLQDSLRVEALAHGWPIGFSIGSVRCV